MASQIVGDVMKTTRYFSLSLSLSLSLMVAYLIFFSTGLTFAGEKEEFEAAKQTSSLNSWKLFLGKYQKGDFVKPARSEFDRILYRTALEEKGNPKRLESLFRRTKTPVYADKIFSLWEEVTWEKANETASIEGYWHYILRFPGGEHIKKAKSITDKLEWLKCREVTGKQRCKEYLRKHPKGQYSKKAKEKISDIEFA